jgi:uncharacterized protein (UPF0332 family)
MSLSDLEAAGELEPRASSPEELSRLLEAAERRLADARIEAVSNQGRFECAYHTILNCALAALRANDYRVDVHAGKHMLTLNTLAETLRLPAAQLRLIQGMRQKRNVDLYEGDRPVSELERDTAIELAQALLAQTKEYVRQLRLDFDGR